MSQRQYKDSYQTDKCLKNYKLSTAYHTHIILLFSIKELKNRVVFPSKQIIIIIIITCINDLYIHTSISVTKQPKNSKHIFNISFSLCTFFDYLYNLYSIRVHDFFLNGLDKLTVIMSFSRWMYFDLNLNNYSLWFITILSYTLMAVITIGSYNNTDVFSNDFLRIIMCT